MAERQIDRIRMAEEAIRELMHTATEIRKGAASLPIADPATKAELLTAAEEFERQAEELSADLRKWREDVH